MQRRSRGWTARLTALITFLACIGMASPAWADYHEDDVLAGWLFLTSTTVGGIVTTVGGVILTVQLATSNNRAMKSYIRHNAVALQEDLTLGAGPTVDDLAGAFGVPEAEVASFGRALRAQQPTLVQLIGDGDIDDARTARFVEIVSAASQGDAQVAERFYLHRPVGS